MNKYKFSGKFLNLLLIMFALVVASCDKKDEEINEAIVLKVIKSDIYFTPQGGDGSIIVEAEPGSKINVETSSGWCTYKSTEKGEGNQQIINLKATSNTAISSRNVSITITDGITSQFVVASQGGDIFYSDEENIERRFDNSKQQFTIDLHSILDYSVDLAVDWITTVEKTNEYVVLELSQNKTGQPRSTIMNLTSKTGVATSYAVYQYDADDLIGSFTSDAIVRWNYAGLYDQVEVNNASISKNSDGSYQISMTLPTQTSSFKYSFRATYDKNALLIETGQYQPGQNIKIDDKQLYAYCIGCNDGGENIYLNGYKVGFAPTMIVENGEVFLIYAFKEEDKPTIASSAYMGMAFFSEEENPSNDTYLPEYTLFFDVRFYNQE